VRALSAAALVIVAACGGSTPTPSVATPVGFPVTQTPACSEPTGSRVVTFVDANLDRVVRASLGVGADAQLTCALLAQVTRLHAPDAGIADLGGIENLVRLGELHVYGHNSIRDVTPLSFLPALTDLSLARNDIEDVGPLAALGTLTSLDLYGNPIRDVAPIGELRGLIRLRLGSGARLTDLEVLSGLALLSRLELMDNAVADLGALASLTHLTRLSLSDNPHLSDLGPLAGLERLEVLDVGGTAVSDVRPLGTLARLHTLILAGTRVHDLGPLMGLTGLWRLDLRGNVQLSDVQPLVFHAAFGDGDAVRLEGTGVSCSDAAALAAKGVVVFSTCP
jgi:Leucine-rich repeat (LRR) protein